MKKVLLIICALISINLLANDERNIVPSELKNATVYKSGAELTHSANATLKQGNNELVIDNIANQLDINSIQIKTASAVTLMGIEFNNNYLIPVEKSSRVKMLEDSVERLQTKRTDLSNALANNDELYQVLKTNRDIKGTQTGMSVLELTKLMDYYKIKLVEIQETKSALQEKMKKIDEAKKQVTKSNKRRNKEEYHNCWKISTTAICSHCWQI